MPKRRFVFSSNDPDGFITVSLLQHDLPPLPAVPTCQLSLSNSLSNSSPLKNNSLSQEVAPLSESTGCQKPSSPKRVIAKLNIPISLVELKQSKHINRWFPITEIPENPETQLGELPLVKISLDFNFRPSRTIESVESLKQIYEIEDTIGSGVSIVKKAVNKFSKKEYACKFLQKQVKGQNIPRGALDNEIELLKSLSHSNIVQLYETLEDSNTIYLIM
jgi:hypothetical protein